MSIKLHFFLSNKQGYLFEANLRVFMVLFFCFLFAFGRDLVFGFPCWWLGGGGVCLRRPTRALCNAFAMRSRSLRLYLKNKARFKGKIFNFQRASRCSAAEFYAGEIRTGSYRFSHAAVHRECGRLGKIAPCPVPFRLPFRSMRRD